ncbi:MAG: PAS domain S-box protein [Cyclobacteriaceae bacterium]
MAAHKKSLLKSILESSLSGIMSFEAIRNSEGVITDFECLYSNDRGAAMKGKRVDEVVEQRMTDVLNDKISEESFQKFVNVVDTGKEDIFEEFFDDGVIQKWFRVSAVKQNDGFTVTFDDISQLKQTMLELESREVKYRKLFEESIDAIFLLDDTFRIVESNGALHRMFGYSREEIAKQNLKSLFCKEEAFELYTTELLKEDRIDELDVDLQDINGKTGPCLINTVKIAPDGVHDTTFLGVIKDMTRRKQADKALIQAEKLSMTGKIARTIAHEVRNPLTNLSLALEQLKDEIGDDVEDADLYFKIVRRNSERIGKLISDLLNSSKPKALNLAFKNINQTLENSLVLVEDRLKLQQMELDIDLQSTMYVQVDDEELQVAFLNIFINALEAMSPENGKLKVRTYDKAKRVFIEIVDNGQGISEENLHKLFEPFFSNKKEGTGLGLVTVQNIIHGHKGQIQVESKVGEGTTFIISFPGTTEMHG